MRLPFNPEALDVDQATAFTSPIQNLVSNAAGGVRFHESPFQAQLELVRQQDVSATPSDSEGEGGPATGTAAAHGTKRPARSKAKRLTTGTLELHTNAWLRIDTRGGCSVIQGDKYKLAHKYGLQTRDLRLLDPSLASSYPSAILYRDHAIVVNLEFARVIITIDFVIVVNQVCATKTRAQPSKARLAPKPDCRLTFCLHCYMQMGPRGKLEFIHCCCLLQTK